MCKKCSTLWNFYTESLSLYFLFCLTSSASNNRFNAWITVISVALYVYIPEKWKHDGIYRNLIILNVELYINWKYKTFDGNCQPLLVVRKHFLLTAPIWTFLAKTLNQHLQSEFGHHFVPSFIRNPTFLHGATFILESCSFRYEKYMSDVILNHHNLLSH